jgi:class 3 adenylate cyclase
MFADVSNFTYWSSNHDPSQVFTLLESLFFEFDRIATEIDVFKLSTVGDCYIAAAGVPYPREDHAVVLSEFAEQCRRKANDVMKELSQRDGMEDVSQLSIRIGIHSGPVTAGVLRGEKARFDLFGDTINTAARIESTGKPNMVHLSSDTAELLRIAGKSDWFVPREKSVSAKGKGELKTFWLSILNVEEHHTSSESFKNSLVQMKCEEHTENRTMGSETNCSLLEVSTPEELPSGMKLSVVI